MTTTIVRRSLVVVLAIGAVAGMERATPAAYAASTYYLSPAGEDRNSGIASSPWKTFRTALPRLAPGDTLILLDGTYTRRNSGRFTIDCTDGPRNGTAGAPITVKAQNERRAQIQSDGLNAALKINDCRYWIFEGLYTTQVDSPSAAGWQGTNVGVYNSHHIVLRRLLVYGTNRYWNTHGIAVESSSDNLVEESEVYFFHRHGISIAHGHSNVIRRNYVDSRSAADVCTNCDGDTRQQSSMRGDEGIDVGYPGSDNIVENNIVVNNYTGIVASNAKGTATDRADRNQILGNIAINNTFGFTVLGRGVGANNTPHDTVFANNVAMNGTHGLYARGSDNTLITNVTIRGNREQGLIADRDMSTPTSECNRYTAPCGDGASSTHITNGLVVYNDATGIHIVTASQEGGWSIDHTNAFDNGYNYLPHAHTNIRSSTTIDPHLGACHAWIPESSPMKHAGTCTSAMMQRGECSTLGAGRADKGANVLYRYDDGFLTTIPLWNPVTGRFPHGATIAGVNDVAGESAFDVHTRLNVNMANCPFPPEYSPRP